MTYFYNFRAEAQGHLGDWSEVAPCCGRLLVLVVHRHCTTSPPRFTLALHATSHENACSKVLTTGSEMMYRVLASLRLTRSTLQRHFSSERCF